MLSPNVFFLAHPVAGDDLYSYEANMQHIKKLTKLCFDAGLMVIAPYFLTCLVLDDNNPAHRKLGMDTNDVVVQKLGCILLTGHKVSSGMEHEAALVVGLPSYRTKEMVVMTGVPDRDFVKQLQIYFPA